MLLGMGRLGRISQRGRVFFITTNLRRGRRNFNPTERTIICKVLDDTRLRRGFRLPGFVVMPNHIHLLILPFPGDFLSKLIQEIKFVTARKINAGRGKRGPLWQKNFFDHYMRTPKKFLKTLDYIHQNPVRKSLTACATDWLWSSAAAYAKADCIIQVDFLNLSAQTEEGF